jgi:hypothetical protein
LLPGLDCPNISLLVSVIPSLLTGDGCLALMCGFIGRLKVYFTYVISCCRPFVSERQVTRLEVNYSIQWLFISPDSTAALSLCEE